MDARPPAEPVWELRKRTELARDHPDYLNPASFGNYFKPVKKLFGMNDIAMPWKRIYATYPELDNVSESRGWSREEIGKMLRNTHDPMERALVLVLASSGVRSGGLDLNWGNLIPVYRVDGSLVPDPGANNGKIACAVLQVYSGSAEGYTAFITPEGVRRAAGVRPHAGAAHGAPAAPQGPHVPGHKGPAKEGVLYVCQEAD